MPHGWPPEIACLTSTVGRGCLPGRLQTAPQRESQVTGLDRNAGMLAVARRLRPQIDWRQGDATVLPFADASYDVVLSQFALMYFPDRTTALKEMIRVLRPGGRLAIAVWGPYERATSYVILTEIAQRRCGQAAADVLTAPFALGEKDTLLDLCKAAGIHDAVLILREGTMTYSTTEVFVETEVKGSPLEALLDAESYQGLMREAQEKLQQFPTDGGAVPMDAFIITATKS